MRTLEGRRLVAFLLNLSREKVMPILIRSFILALALLGRTESALAHEPPKIAVIIAIDQFPQEYLERFAPYFGEGGFRRLTTEGAVYRNALLPFANTYTAPGHAAIGTGTLPRTNGIVGNTWFDRVRDEDEYCVEDDRALPSSGSSDPVSPINLAEDSLGDRLQSRYPGAKVIGVSYKDRSAILMAGRKAQAAYWFDDDIPAFVSTDYYAYNLEVLRFNEKVKPFIAANPRWTPSNLISSDDLAKITFDPPALRKFKTPTFAVEFPHPVTTGESLKYTPFSNDLLLDFAEHIIEIEKLGRDDIPDLLFVSISSPDYIGHHYGPDSLETADSVLRLDRSIARFISGLEKRFGSTFVIGLTSDHGVQSIPEVARARGRDAGRVDLIAPTKAKTIGEFRTHRRQLELAAAKRLGLPTTPASPRTAGLVRYFEQPALYFNWTRIRELGLDGELVKRIFKEEALKIKGIQAAFTNTELMRSNAKAGPSETALRLAFRPDRSGDVLMVLRDGYIWNYDNFGTTHGQPVRQDQHVPLIFWGAGVKKGIHNERVSPLLLATTIGAIFGLQIGEPRARPLPVYDFTAAAPATR